MSVAHVDFETRSDIDLKACGLYNYARGRNTDILCMAYAFDDEPVELWIPGQPPPPERLFKHVINGGEVHAHNAPFELEIWNNVGIRRYNFPKLSLEQMVCTMAMSYAMALPGHLGSTAAALGLQEGKDAEGQRVMLQYCQPREVKPDGTIVWWDDHVQLQKIYNYCKRDVEVERNIEKRMLKLSPYERDVWRLDQLINQRGIAVDTKAVFSALKICEEEKLRLIKEIQNVSGNKIASPQAVAQIKAYLGQKGIDRDSLAKQEVVELLGKSDLPEDCRRILELRQEAGKTSTAKLEPMLQGATRCADGSDRLRGMFQYSGAATRRWAGRRVQLQNLPRPKFSSEILDNIVERLNKGTIDAKTLDTIYGSSLDVISSCLRSMLCSGPGHDLLACDFSSIEARGLAWLAGEEKTLSIFRTHGKIYEAAAADIFQVPIIEVTPEQRQIGKVAVLALGYGGGVGAFQMMARGYGVRLAPAYNALWARASSDQKGWAFKLHAQHVAQCRDKNETPIPQYEFMASELTKLFWRQANPAIVDFWSDLERAACNAVAQPGIVQRAGMISYRMKGSFLFCQLPSGGVLCYPYPKVESVQLPWGGEKLGLTYMSEDGQSKKWMRFKTYGGSLAENVTQAVSRDLLADAMLRLEAKGYPVVAHVHDEIICEMPEDQGSVEQMAEIMCQKPVWAKDFPIAASGFRGKRYKK